MKEVTLSAKEQIMYDETLLVIDGVLSVAEAARRLGVSTRTVYRKIDTYITDGIKGFSHGLSGHSPANALDLTAWSTILSLYKTKYEGYNWSHFRDKLRDCEEISIGYATLYGILTEAGFTSPRAHKKKRKCHPLRPRRCRFGELVQMDASLHVWFGSIKTTLHLAIDDATSQILGGHFESQETLHGYYEVFKQILTRYGVPRAFYTDRRTVFEYQRHGAGELEKDYHTQFQLASAQLGVVHIHTTSVPQAKGRIERAFNTFQDRLVSEMRTANITTMTEANAFLVDFIKCHNIQFALDETGLVSAFGDIPTKEEINLALAIVTERKVLSGCSVSYHNKQYIPYSPKGQVYLSKGSSVTVIKAFDETLYLSLDDRLWPLAEAGKSFSDKDISLPEGRLYDQRRYEYLLKKYRQVA